MSSPSARDASFDGILRAAIEGDPEAFEHIYRTYAGRILAFARARGNDDPEAVANDVMLRSFQNLSSFNGDEPAFVRWLFTIARHRIIDLHRAANRRPKLADESVPERSDPSAEDVAFDRLSLDDVSQWLGLLTAEQREVVALRLVADLSLADVAEIVGRPVTAVKALQRRGLRRLQREISG